MNYEVIKINNDTWSIEDDFVRFFLLKGKDKALMIDSGIDIENVKALARAVLNGPKDGVSWREIEDGTKVTLEGEYVGQYKEPSDDDLPLELLNTHGDGDHCFGNKEFDWFFLHEADWPHYRRQFGEKGTPHPIEDGEIIDPGY